jgi:hypothetical protein
MQVNIKPQKDLFYFTFLCVKNSFPQIIHTMFGNLQSFVDTLPDSDV